MEKTAENFDLVISAYISNCTANEIVPSTVAYYKRILLDFNKSMTNSGIAPIWPTVEAVSKWKQDLCDRKLKITTLDIYMRVLRNFMEWAVDMGMMESSCCIPAVMPNPKIVNKATRKPYSDLLDGSSVMRIFNHETPKNVSERIWRRNRAILVLFLSTGIRNSELRGLNLSDLDFDGGKILVRNGKGSKTRYVSFPTIAKIAIKDYLNSGYRPCSVSDDEPLFGITDNRYESGWHGMKRTALSQLVERNLRLVLGKEGIRSHALRHSYASVMWDSGAELSDISSILGHSSVTTTERYAERLRPSAPIDRANSVFDNWVSMGS